MRYLTVFIFGTLIAIMACTAPNTTGGKQRYSRDVLSAEEINSRGAKNAYELIQQLRPHWLSGRGARSLKYAAVSYPVIYVNESKHGGLRSLETLSPEYITEIRFMNAGDATIRFGFNHPGGAILVTI